MACNKLTLGEIIMSSVVVIYGTNVCGYCIHARNLLDSKGIKYEDIRLEIYPNRRQEMEKLSGATSVPQIWINEKHIGGCMELVALDDSGELEKLLETKNNT